jgi:hypothetical protein
MSQEMQGRSPFGLTTAANASAGRAVSLRSLIAGISLVLVAVAGCQNSGSVTPNGVQDSPTPASTTAP